MLSVNQLNAQIKLTEIWKAPNIEDYPITVCKSILLENERASRAKAQGKLIEKGVTNLVKESFLNDGVRLWNLAPGSITKSSSIYGVKRAIKEFVTSLPI